MLPSVKKAEQKVVNDPNANKVHLLTGTDITLLVPIAAFCLLRGTEMSI